MTYQDYFNGINFNDVNSLIDFFEKRHQLIKERIIELSKCMVNMKTLAKHQGDFYVYRQNLLSEKFNCMKLSNIFLKQLKEFRKDVSKAYRLGKPDSKGIARDINIVLKNNDERELHYSADLKEYEYRLSVVDNHLAFVVDSIANVINMIYGFEMVKELQAFNNSI